MKLSVSTLAILFIVLMTATGHTTQSGKTAKTDIPETLQVHESDVSRGEYERAIEHLEKLEGFIRNSKTVPDIVDSARFYVGYPNSLLRIEGYVLYLEAQLAKAKFEVAELKMKAGKISKQDLETFRTQVKESEKAFKDYLENSRFSD
ncbi:MAG: hypothetical protein AABZ15_10950 [Nitrospirota bacterium]